MSSSNGAAKSGIATAKPIAPGFAHVNIEASSSSTAPVRTIVLDRTEAQLTELEQMEAREACGEIRDAIGEIHVYAGSLDRHRQRGNPYLKRDVMEEGLQKLVNAAGALQRSLKKLPYMCVLLACLALTGCCGDRRDEPQSDTAVSACKDGHCRLK